MGVSGVELTTGALLIEVEHMISRDGGLKARYEQRSNETHLGVGEANLAMVNTFARVKEGDMGSNGF